MTTATISAYCPSLYIGRTAMGQHLLMMSMNVGNDTVLGNCGTLRGARDRAWSLVSPSTPSEDYESMRRSVYRMRARAV